MDFVGKKDVKVEDLWMLYKQTGDATIRDQLVTAYTYLVYYVANRFPSGYSTVYDHDDLVSYGILGLLDAIDKFDLDKGVKFQTYAVARIKGTILDYMRKLDWVPRATRKKAKDIAFVCGKLETELMRTATDAEISCALGLTKDQYLEVMQQISQANLISLEGEIFKVFNGQERINPLDFIKDEKQLDPSIVVEWQELKDVLTHSINSLPEKEKIVIGLYYYEGLTLKEIGLVMELSESRISQLHTKAIMRMRGKLSKAKSKGDLVTT